MAETGLDDDHLNKTIAVVCAYVAANPIPPEAVPGFLKNVHATIRDLDGQLLEAPQAPMDEAPPPPAVPIKKSITPDYLICLEDGRKLKMLKRHLHKTYGLTPAAYRRRWNLPASYPMVAPNYAKTRRELALRIGLGSMGRREKKPSAVAPVEALPKKPASPKKSASPTAPLASPRKLRSNFKPSEAD